MSEQVTGIGDEVDSNKLGKDFGLCGLFKFGFAIILLNIWTAIYQIIDGAISSRLISTDALSAINIIYPIISIEEALACMLCGGGAAIIAKKMGEGKQEEANQNLSFITLVGFVVGIIWMVAVTVMGNPFMRLLGADNTLMPLCKSYFDIHRFFGPIYIVSLLYQVFLVVKGKPQLATIFNVAQGAVTIAADFLFVGALHMGISGSALGSGCGMLVSGVLSILSVTSKKQPLHLTKPVFDIRMLGNSCWIGMGDLILSVAMAVLTALYNIQAMKYYGPDGVAVITILLYAQFLFVASYYGFGKGIGPIFSYNLGAKNFDRIKKIFKEYGIIYIIMTIIIGIGSLFMAKPIILLFTSEGTSVYKLCYAVWIVFSLNYLFAGINFMAQCMFASFNDGKRAAIISIMRTTIVPIFILLVFPLFMGGYAIWVALLVSEVLTGIISAVLLVTGRKQYKY